MTTVCRHTLESTTVKSPKKEADTKWEIFDSNTQKTSPTMPILDVQIPYDSYINRVFSFSATAIFKSLHLAQYHLPIPFVEIRYCKINGQQYSKSRAKFETFTCCCAHIFWMIGISNVVWCRKPVEIFFVNLEKWSIGPLGHLEHGYGHKNRPFSNGDEIDASIRLG